MKNGDVPWFSIAPWLFGDSRGERFCTAPGPGVVPKSSKVIQEMDGL